MSAEAGLVRIRAARPYDAAALLELKRQLDRETAFMMYEPGERDSPVQDLAAELASVARSANSVVLQVELEDGPQHPRHPPLRAYGFSVEGRRSECLLVDDQFIDELTMAVLLPAPPASP